jgi:hypothetical protein
MSEPRRPWEPFQPSTPKPNELGRLTATSPLSEGWPCRHCGRPLVDKLRNQKPNPFGPLLLCGNCDRPDGKTPA